eukprot:CAMPEP_0172583966 /NCGR_PEP_ID=MMETSP1068-20121228/3531_1 /TAXON_ID=35684 /ORGANISM="Pseudopedinella elastica, Strain CCMP716" /LENGTH=147 /DNA_ID=CAMNT_0013377961 /DNA_START=394 /DNA_END=837 /DNA_ORIENTATION=-
MSEQSETPPHNSQPWTRRPLLAIGLWIIGGFNRGRLKDSSSGSISTEDVGSTPAPSASVPGPSVWAWGSRDKLVITGADTSTNPTTSADQLTPKVLEIAAEIEARREASSSGKESCEHEGSPSPKWGWYVSTGTGSATPQGVYPAAT